MSEPIPKVKRALDVDGVLANFYLAMCRRFGQEYVVTDRWGVPWLNERLPEVDGDFDFWDNLPNMNRPDAITFDFDYYITAIPAKYKDSRIAWLKHHGYPDKPVIIAFDKAKAMKSRDVKILIDDKYENVEKVHAAGMHAIHYVPDYLYPQPQQTHHPKLTVKHLSEVNEKILNIERELWLKEKKLWV
jgi:hypothetical protein